MGYRDTEYYKQLTPYVAVFGEHETEDEQLTAWQWILDTGLWRSLEGFYGRQIQSFLDAGLIEPPV